MRHKKEEVQPNKRGNTKTGQRKFTDQERKRREADIHTRGGF
ncbi:hypothetical protein [Alkalibacillus aidingensis]|nr:hypothetical protein [Alkalibacillus aidingensis]